MSEWIDVKNSLPQDDEYVMTYCEYSIKPIRVNWYSTHRETWHEGDDGITHWMPLPDDPETQERKQKEADYMKQLQGAI